MITRISLAIGAASGLILGLMLFYLINAAFLRPAAVNEGREMERTAALSKAVELMKQRSKTNAEIRSLSPGALCTGLGGEWVQDECK